MKTKTIFAMLLVWSLPLFSQMTVNYQRFTLPNGLTVILHEDHTLPTVSVNMWYHVGSGREHQGRTGFAHLFENIMFGKGSSMNGSRPRAETTTRARPPTGRTITKTAPRTLSS